MEKPTRFISTRSTCIDSYEFAHEPNLGYRFETVDQVIYTVYVAQYSESTNMALRILSFNCSVKSKKIKEDKRIRMTIRAILLEYLLEFPDHVFIYFCQDGLARYKLYKIWEKEINIESEFNFYTNFSYVSSARLYYGMLTLKNSINWEHAELMAKEMAEQDIDLLK